MKKLSKNLAFILNNIKESGLLNEARVGQQGIKARLRTGLISDDSKEKWLQTKEKMGKDKLLNKITKNAVVNKDEDTTPNWKKETKKVLKDISPFKDIAADSDTWKKDIQKSDMSKRLKQDLVQSDPKERHLDKMRRGIKSQYKNTGTYRVGFPSGGLGVAAPVGMTLPIPGYDKFITQPKKTFNSSAVAVKKSIKHLGKATKHFKNGNYLGAHKSMSNAIKHFKSAIPTSSIVLSPDEENTSAAVRRFADKLENKGKVGSLAAKAARKYADAIETGAQRITSHEGDEAIRSDRNKRDFTFLTARGKQTNAHMGMQVPHDEFNELRAYKADVPQAKSEIGKKAQKLASNVTTLQGARIWSGEKGTDELVRSKKEHEIRNEAGLSSKEPLTNKQVQNFEKKIFNYYEDMSNKAKNRTHLSKKEEFYDKGKKIKISIPKIELSATPEALLHPIDYSKALIKQKVKDKLIDTYNKKVKPEISRVQSIRRSAKNRKTEPDIPEGLHWPAVNRSWLKSLKHESYNILYESLVNNKKSIENTFDWIIENNIKSPVSDNDYINLGELLKEYDTKDIHKHAENITKLGAISGDRGDYKNSYNHFALACALYTHNVGYYINETNSEASEIIYPHKLAFDLVTCGGKKSKTILKENCNIMETHSYMNAVASARKAKFAKDMMKKIKTE